VKSERLKDRSLGAGILVLGILTLILGWSFFQRIGAPRPDPTRIFNPGDLLGEIIQVEVRNGCGVTGLAARMTEFLRSYGFDVVEHGDYKSFDVEKTLVVDRIGNLDAAKQVALALGIEEAEIVSEVDEGSYLDVSVIIGMDYASVVPFIDERGAEEEAGGGESAAGH
jgi:hypothetical protein